MKDIYELKLNESTQTQDYLITRVPDGWLYERKGNIIHIKYNAEFQQKSPYQLVGVNNVIDIVRVYYNLPEDFIESKSRDGNIPLAKQIIIKVLANYLKLKQKIIKEYLHYDNRSTVSNNLSTLNKILENNTQIKIDYEYILDRIKNIRTLQS